MREGTTVARELVERLWKDPPEAPQPSHVPVVPTLPPSDHIVHRPDLGYLNRRWVWTNDAGTNGRGGFRRRLKLRLARLIARSIDSYFAEERAFIEHLVRFQNDVARKSDQLSDEIRHVAATDRSLVAWMQDQIDDLSRKNELLHGLLEARIERLEASQDGARTSPR
jgi:hypothetical protein